MWGFFAVLYQHLCNWYPLEKIWIITRYRMKGGGCKVRSQLQNTHSRSSYMLYIVSILMDIYRVIKKKAQWRPSRFQPLPTTINTLEAWIHIPHSERHHYIHNCFEKHCAVSLNPVDLRWVENYKSMVKTRIWSFLLKQLSKCFTAINLAFTYISGGSQNNSPSSG